MIRSAAISLAVAVVLAAIAPALPASAAVQSVTGTLTLDGTVLPGVEVGWYDPLTRHSGETVSAADGTFALTIADGESFYLYGGIDHDASAGADDRAWLRVRKNDFVGVFLGANGQQDHLYQTLAPIPALTTPATGVALDLDKPGTISGSAADLSGLEISRTNWQVVSGGKANAAGVYAVTGLIPGTYCMRAQQTEKAGRGEWKSGDIVVRSGETTTVDPSFSAASATLTGVVRSGGKPVKGLAVTAGRTSGGGSDVTDAHGRYRIEHLEAGSYTLYFGFGGGYGEKSVWLPEHTKVTLKADATRKVNRAVTRGTTVSGTVTGATSDFVTITVLDTSGSVIAGRSVQVKSTTKPTSFHLNGVPAGTQRIVIADQKHYASLTARVSGRTTAIGTAALTRKTLTLTGTVTGGKYAEVFYTLGTYSERGDEVDYPTRSYAVVKKGRYTLTGVVPGKARIDVSSTGYAGRSYSLTVTGSATKNLERGKKYQFAVVTGTLTFGGVPVLRTYGYVTRGAASSQELGGFSVEAGHILGKVGPGTVRLSIASSPEFTDIVDDSPFWMSLPASASKVTITAKTTVDLGTIEATLHR